jgi:ABC-2 type transport system ATP-binding protein
MTDLPVIQTHRLCKSWGHIEAVRDLTLSVASHRITGFLGANGAGKSTTIKMLLGMIRPTGGEAAILGGNVADPVANVRIRRDVAYVSEDKRLYGYMTVEQTIRFTAAFYPDWRADIAARLMKTYQLPPDRKVKSLSKGMRTKLGLLLAFARRPKLLILDEPTEGLDPLGVEQLLESLVSRCGEGTTVFFSSHQIEEVERIADRVCIIDHGRLLRDVSLDEIRENYRRIDLVFPFEAAELEFPIAGVESVRARGRQIVLLSSSNTDKIVARARACHATEVEVTPVGLREIFLRIVKESSHALV